MLAAPPSGRIKVARIRTMVVLPAPFGPSKAKTDPVGMVRSTSVQHKVGAERFRDPRGNNCVVHTQNGIRGTQL